VFFSPFLEALVSHGEWEAARKQVADIVDVLAKVREGCHLEKLPSQRFHEIVSTYPEPSFLQAKGTLSTNLSTS